MFVWSVSLTACKRSSAVNGARWTASSLNFTLNCMHPFVCLLRIITTAISQKLILIQWRQLHTCQKHSFQYVSLQWVSHLYSRLHTCQRHAILKGVSHLEFRLYIAVHLPRCSKCTFLCLLLKSPPPYISLFLQQRWGEQPLVQTLHGCLMHLCLLLKSPPQ